MSDLIEVVTDAIDTCVADDGILRVNKAAAAILRSIAARGYRIVPMEPDDEWIELCCLHAAAIDDREWENFEPKTAKAFMRKALAAAPKVPA